MATVRIRNGFMTVTLTVAFVFIFLLTVFRAGPVSTLTGSSRCPVKVTLRTCRESGSQHEKANCSAKPFLDGVKRATLVPTHWFSPTFL